jgi:hypothetical protein
MKKIVASAQCDGADVDASWTLDLPAHGTGEAIR